MDYINVKLWALIFLSLFWMCLKSISNKSTTRATTLLFVEDIVLVEQLRERINDKIVVEKSYGSTFSRSSRNQMENKSFGSIFFRLSRNKMENIEHMCSKTRTEVNIRDHTIVPYKRPLGFIIQKQNNREIKRCKS